jgi:hypothetical protein
MADAALIYNPSLDPFTLPYPLFGVLPAGRGITIAATVVALLAACPTLQNGVRLTQLPSDYAGPFDSGYGFITGASIVPTLDNDDDLGTVSLRWRRAYLGSGLITPSIGPVLAQQHTVPAIASDTLALLAAQQTLTNKTLTAPRVDALKDTLGATVLTVTATASAVRGLTYTAGTTGVNARLTASGENGAGLDLCADPLGSVGSIRLRNPGNTATVLGVEPTAAGVACITMQAAAPVRAATVTANAPAGIITFDAADAIITVNNSCVGAQSFVLATVNSIDATMTTVRAVVTAPGQFTLNANVAATSNDVAVGFLVINAAS